MRGKYGGMRKCSFSPENILDISGSADTACSLPFLSRFILTSDGVRMPNASTTVEICAVPHRSSRVLG